MKNNEIKISQNFWTELEARGFLDQKNTGGNSVLDFPGSVEKTQSGEYRILNAAKKSLICFVNSDVFIKALKMTEDKVKYRLFY